MSQRFSGHDPEQGSDTAGQPWAGRDVGSTGRTLAGSGFDTDDGLVDRRLQAAMGQPHEEEALVAAVHAARILVPIVAVAGKGASSDMASVTASAPDGTRALLAFSSVAALTSWDMTARPVPVTAQRAALAAVQEGCDVIVLDVGSSDTVTLRSSMVWALAMDRAWQPAHTDAGVQSAMQAACAAQPAVVGHRLSAGPGGALVVTLAMLPGLQASVVQAAVHSLAERIASDGETRARIDAIRFRVTQAGAPS
ncbi:MAG: SseB family protein [Ornithinimicrobium sp.]